MYAQYNPLCQRNLDQARRKASAQGSTLNEEFRRWLAGYVQSPAAASSFRQLMDRLSHVNAQAPYPRDELNAR